MFQHQRVALEQKMCAAFDVLIANPDFGGQYYSCGARFFTMDSVVLGLGS
jgi:hypothetical protein